MGSEPNSEALQRENSELRARVAELEGSGGRRCLQHVLHDGAPELLREWERRVLRDPLVSEADRLSRPALQDHVPALVEELAEALDRAGKVRSTLGERLGRTVWHSPNALAHAETRFEQGYSLAEVLRELSHFRSAVIERCRRVGAGLSTDELHVVHVAIDEAMTVAAAELERIAWAALEAGEHRYRALVEGVRDYAVFMLDAEGCVATWNPGAERLQGWQEDEIRGQPYQVFFTADARAEREPRQLLAEARSRGSHQGRHPRVRRDGSVYVADVTLAAIYSPTGEVIGYSEVSRNVSEQLEAQLSLARSQARLDVLLSSTFDAVLALDVVGRVILFNPSAERMFGRPAADVIGQPLDALIDDAGALATTAPGPLPPLVGRRLDGSPFSLEGTLSEVDVSDLHYRTLVLRDATAHVASERARREAEARLQAILDNALAIIFVKDLEGRYQLVNRRFEEVFGRSSREVVGRTDAELFPPETAAIFRRSDLQVLARAAPVEAEEVVDGTTYVTVKFPLRDSSDTIRATAGMATDITERVRAREALERALELRELFVGVLAHDLRSPLQVVSTAAAVLMRGRLAPQQEATVERIAAGARQMATMVEQLLDVTRAQAGQPMPLDRRPTDLGDLCRAVVDGLLTLHDGRTIEVAVQGDVRGCWDRSRLEQLVGNLLTNALAYSPSGTPVQVRVHGAGDTVSVEVTNANVDTPLPVETLASLFDPFARGSRRSGTGLGLGLFIVDQIARAHGGEVHGASDESGTTFAVRLPRARSSS